MTPGLRILHAIRSDAFAGVEQFVRRLAIAQAAARHTVTVAGGAETQMRSLLSSAGVSYRPAARTAEVARAVRGYASEMDIVNTHMTAADTGAVLALALRSDRPAVIATRHFAQRRGSIGPGAFYRAVEHGIDAEIAISRSVAAAIGVPSTIVHPGVEPAPPNDPSERRRVALIAQRLEPEKHTALGLEAFAAAGLARQGWSLQIAGDGSERTNLVHLADTLGIGQSVRFLGFRSDLSELMARASILIATAPFEHFGLSVLEAMAAGLPIVAADAAGHTEMLSGLDPRALFTPDNARSAADNIASLAHDDAGRAAYGRDVRERQQRDFTLKAQAEATEHVYRSVLDGRLRRRATGERMP